MRCRPLLDRALPPGGCQSLGPEARPLSVRGTVLAPRFRPLAGRGAAAHALQEHRLGPRHREAPQAQLLPEL